MGRGGNEPSCKTQLLTPLQCRISRTGNFGLLVVEMISLFQHYCKRIIVFKVVDLQWPIRPMRQA